MDGFAARFDETHRQVQKLLPWYVTDQLEPADRARVADHLAACTACRAECADERVLNDGVARMPLDLELNWAAMRRRVEVASARPWPRARRAMLRIVGRPRAAAFVIAAQVAVLVAAVAVIPSIQHPAPYRVLGAAPVTAAGNVIVMFSPGATTAGVAHALAANDARIVDGPTAAGAFVLAVPADRRALVIARLRAQPSLVMAEPLDP